RLDTNSHGHIGRTEVAARNQLGDDTDRYFGYRLGADVEAERSMHSFKLTRRDALGDEILVDDLDLPLAADHADITGGTVRQMIERFFIMTVTARHDNAVARRINRAPGQFLERAADLSDHDPLGG